MGNYFRFRVERAPEGNAYARTEAITFSKPHLTGSFTKTPQWIKLEMMPSLRVALFLEAARLCSQANRAGPQGPQYTSANSRRGPVRRMSTTGSHVSAILQQNVVANHLEDCKK